MKKTILSLIAGILMFPAVGFAEDAPKKQAQKKQETPFERYRTLDYQLPCEDFYIKTPDGWELGHAHPYDTNKDGKKDGAEIYIYKLNGKRSDHPKYYWVDSDDNGIMENFEVIIDRNMDGWDGDGSEIFIWEIGSKIWI